jgi:hypothetical protein
LTMIGRLRGRKYNVLSGYERLIDKWILIIKRGS